jgi:hypothetical protein
MKVPPHIIKHAFEYIVIAVLGFLGLAALAYMDLRHITREDWTLKEIKHQDQEIQKQKLYNQFGTPGNKPARDQIILQTEQYKEELERELKQIQD